MAFGLGAMRLTPAAFWGMTMRELAAVVNGLIGRDTSLRRGRLAELMGRFPDENAKR
jgi:uncharacterized phage protein (TIGR02216 family)